MELDSWVWNNLVLGKMVLGMMVLDKLDNSVACIPDKQLACMERACIRGI